MGLEPHVQLEAEWADFAGCRPQQVVACSSGTAALHLALEALQLPQGAEVLLPDLTMVACARAVALAGLTPAFVDCGDDLLVQDWPVDDRTAAVMAVHVYGRKADMEAVHRVAGRRPRRDGACPRAGSQYVAVVEDLAEAHGVQPHPQTDAACWSVYRNKIVAGQEGGVVCFRDPERARLARSLRSLGFTDAHDFQHVPRGHNYRMSSAHAEAVLPSLRAVHDNLRARRVVEAEYDRHCPVEWRMPRRDVVWVYDLRLPGLDHERQTAVVRALQAAGIAARHCFRPMSRQEEFHRCRLVGGDNAAKLAREVIYLPAWPGMPFEDCRGAFDVIRAALDSQ